jgi:hypothetical protein
MPVNTPVQESTHWSEMRQSRTRDMQPAQDLVSYFRKYARENPEVVAMWCLGIGFVLGWKLKPW